MATPSQRASASTSRSSQTNKSTSQGHDPEGIVPAHPSSLVNQSDRVPGPNAFAQRKTTDQTATNELPTTRSRQPTSDGAGDPYTVSMYQGMQPSPPFRSGFFSVQKRATFESPTSNSSRGWSEATGSPTAHTFAQRPELRSEFSLRLQHERSRFDTDGKKKATLEREADRLKLVPSPDSKVYETPTHRMQLDERNASKFQQQVAGSSTNAKDISASHPNREENQSSRQRSRTPTPLRLQHSNKKLAQNITDSPKKSFFNRLGLGGPNLKPTPPKNPHPTPDPAKAELAGLRNVPHKAAKVLGTHSLGSRYPKPLASRDDVGLFTDSPTHDVTSPASSDDIRRAASAPSKPRFQVCGHEDQGFRESIRSQGDEFHNRPSRDIPDVTPERQTARDEDVPPTPPSKSTLHERYAEQNNVIRDSSCQTTGSSTKDLQFPTVADNDGPPMLKRTGYVSRPFIVDKNPKGNVIARSSPEQSAKTDSNVISNNKLRDSNRKYSVSSPRRSLFKTIPEGGTLPATIYSPSVYSMYQDHSHGNQQPSPYSNLSVSPTQLRPVPLNIPPHIRQEQSQVQTQSPPSSGSDNKSRDTSNSTSASVPIYLETPSTASPDVMLALRDSQIMVKEQAKLAHRSTKEIENEKISLHETSKHKKKKTAIASGTKADNDGAHFTKVEPVDGATSNPKEQEQTRITAYYRAMSPTSSRVRPSYETMTDAGTEADAQPSSSKAEEKESETGKQKMFSPPWPVALCRSIHNLNQYGERDHFPTTDNSNRAEDMSQDSRLHMSGLPPEAVLMLQNMREDHSAGKEAISRVEGAIGVLSTRIEELNGDVRAILRLFCTAASTNGSGSVMSTLSDTLLNRNQGEQVSSQQPSTAGSTNIQAGTPVKGTATRDQHRGRTSGDSSTESQARETMPPTPSSKRRHPEIPALAQLPNDKTSVPSNSKASDSTPGQTKVDTKTSTAYHKSPTIQRAKFVPPTVPKQSSKAHSTWSPERDASKAKHANTDVSSSALPSASLAEFEGAKDSFATRVYRSLPARTREEAPASPQGQSNMAQRKGTREYLMGLQQERSNDPTRGPGSGREA